MGYDVSWNAPPLCHSRPFRSLLVAVCLATLISCWDLYGAAIRWEMEMEELNLIHQRSPGNNIGPGWFIDAVTRLPFLVFFLWRSAPPCSLEIRMEIIVIFQVALSIETSTFRQPRSQRTHFILEFLTVFSGFSPSCGYAVHILLHIFWWQSFSSRNFNYYAPLNYHTIQPKGKLLFTKSTALQLIGFNR